MRKKNQLDRNITMFLMVMICVVFSGCSKEVGDVRPLAKDYYSDMVGESSGESNGVGPTQKKKPEQVKDLGRRTTQEYDFGDEGPDTITTKAWESLNAKDEKGVLLFTDKCIELYEDEAKSQAVNLIEFPKGSTIDTFKIMNDVAACYFIRGEFFKYNKNWSGATQAYQTLIDYFPFAKYWDPRGWYWNPAEIAKDEIRKISEGYYEAK